MPKLIRRLLLTYAVMFLGNAIVCVAIALMFKNTEFALLLTTFAAIPALGGWVFAGQGHANRALAANDRLERAKISRASTVAAALAAGILLGLVVLPLDFWVSLYLGAWLGGGALGLGYLIRFTAKRSSESTIK